MKQKRMFLGVIGLALLPLAASAQIYQDVSNSTATVVRDPARQASTEIDAVLFNPAGTALLDDGWHFSLNGKLSYRNFSYGDTYSTSEKTTADYIPSLQVAYKFGSLALSFSIGNEGGYGTWALSEDEMMTNVFTNVVNPIFKTYTEFMSPYASSCSPYDQLISKTMVSGGLYNYSARFGAAYQLNSHWSIYAGLRLNYVTESTHVSFNQWVSKLDKSIEYPNNYFNKVNDEFQQSMQKLEGEASSPEEKLLPIIAEVLGGYLSAEMSEMSYYTPIVDVRTNGWGITPVIGVDFNADKLNFAAKYEFETKITPQGSGLSYHLPGVASLGASWQAKDDLKIAVGGNLYHQKSNSMYGREQSLDFTYAKNFHFEPTRYQTDGGFVSGDLSASVSFAPTDRLSLSIGYTYAMQQPLMVKTFFAQSAVNGGYFNIHTVSGGVRYEINDNIQLDFGVSKKMSLEGYYSTLESMENYRGVNLSAGININL